MLTDEEAISRCIQIGKNGLGTTRPNPMVGAIIVHSNTIIGEGFTDPHGGPHAEVNAINSVKNQELLKESTIYVTLEPCSHHGKTPPCTDLIISKGITRVVIGCLDDNPLVAGNGVRRLKATGIKVSTGVLEAECRDHHKRFFTFFNKKRPYIILKWAESSDGFIAPNEKNEKKPVWITNAYSRQLVHKWRAEEQAILVGGNTVTEDNPSLTVRDWTGHNPVRIVISNNIQRHTDLNIFNDESKTIVTNGNLESLMGSLYDEGINSIIIEGGTQTLQSFINNKLWDEARVFYGAIEFGEGIEAPKLNAAASRTVNLETDLLKYFHND
ncbi:bifunctional diaminohydroxyphosphoribosylaminopyrimidine deaminase/5-amino-6-(5-phosphoribosylamino)uracil reductase RibD [Winogradskyella aurantiaca]|uniref:bifunctional diaminohydroxyphosphoribosylaminopyrimidine deaminase/5-amino-6-(5-phosphoribosylamino)uracil reductase RibD n=1 Tax=Winogradskyella aurantiaca TaxID=2219558 RepID=UPI000E1CC6CD|nr:bifunctional diaminohydroxyphosphoribosylaminopyrimidine deaminase/5-amino-6-(5-phosphoribosylamino)uracil reductase RibD [Winogradskyella aurantiaca]